MTPHRVVHRLHLRESKLKCPGSERDEAVVQAIANALRNDLHKDPILSSRQVRRRVAAQLPASTSLAVVRLRQESTRGIADSGPSLGLIGSVIFSH